MPKLLYSIIGSLLLFSCSPVQEQSDSKWNELSIWDSFSIQSSTNFQKKIIRDNGSLALTTYDNSSTNRRPEDYSIHLYLLHSTSCDASTTGYHDPHALPSTNSEAEWGRMDAWDGYGQEGWEYPANWERIICKKEGVVPPKEVYVLCAEKDEKTVVVCINQMTDNLQLAEEIFKTFRWIDE